jgi:hypothetical protein
MIGVAWGDVDAGVHVDRETGARLPSFRRPPGRLGGVGARWATSLPRDEIEFDVHSGGYQRWTEVFPTQPDRARPGRPVRTHGRLRQRLAGSGQGRLIHDPDTVSTAKTAKSGILGMSDERRVGVQPQSRRSRPRSRRRSMPGAVFIRLSLSCSSAAWGRAFTRVFVLMTQPVSIRTLRQSLRVPNWRLPAFTRRCAGTGITVRNADERGMSPKRVARVWVRCDGRVAPACVRLIATWPKVNAADRAHGLCR